MFSFLHWSKKIEVSHVINFLRLRDPATMNTTKSTSLSIVSILSFREEGRADQKQVAPVDIEFAAGKEDSGLNPTRVQGF
jgi:hypothetical protein